MTSLCNLVSVYMDTGAIIKMFKVLIAVDVFLKSG